MKLKTVVLIEARMNSSRLPGKVIKNLGKNTVIGVLIDRVKRAKNIDNIVVITSKKKENDVLVKLIKKKNVHFFRGSELNVYKRFIEAAEKFQAKIAIRLTADNPLVDPKMIDSMIKFYKKNSNIHYLCNGYKSDFKSRQLPFGLDIELINPKILKSFKNQVNSKKLKEHTTLVFFRKKKHTFKNYEIKNFKFKSKVRLTIDTLKDFEMINKLYLLLYKKYKNKFDVKNISNILIKNKWLYKINEKIKQKKIN